MSKLLSPCRSTAVDTFRQDNVQSDLVCRDEFDVGKEVLLIVIGTARLSRSVASIPLGFLPIVTGTAQNERYALIASNVMSWRSGLLFAAVGRPHWSSTSLHN